MNFAPRKESVKICPKCGTRHANTTAIFCETCRPKFRGKFCFKHTFNILKMDSNRVIKCNTEFCTETRNA